MGEPIFLIPHCVQKPWAGQKFNDDSVGETWECSKKSIISRGRFQGLLLENLFSDHPELFGYQEIPILTKFIDAGDWLSIQVHPDDEQAQLLEGLDNGKTEAWVFIDVDDGEVINGIIRLPRDDESYEEVVHKTSVKTGDVMTIAPGTVHAIGPKILLYEVQQYSDSTYRLYDWHRTDRELHLEKARQVATTNIADPSKIICSGQIIHDTDYFQTINYYSNDEIELISSGDVFEILVLIDGYGQVIVDEISYDWSFGETMIIPRNHRYKIVGVCQFLVSFPKKHR